MGAVFSFLVPVALKFPPAMRTGQSIKRLAVYQIRVFLPPYPAAGFGAEFSCWALWFLYQRLPALPAGLPVLLLRNSTQIIAPAKALNRIQGNPKTGRYGAIGKALAA